MSTERSIKDSAIKSTIELAKLRFSGISSEVTAETAKNEAEYIETIYNKLKELYADEKSTNNQ